MSFTLSGRTQAVERDELKALLSAGKHLKGAKNRSSERRARKCGPARP